EQLIIEKGKGSYLYDTKGNKYLDGVSSLWVTVHGHQKKEIDQAIKKQLKKIAHSTLLGLGNVPSIKLAEQLVKITPKRLNKVFYSDNGSTAVEIALKIAYQYWKQARPKTTRPQDRKTKFLTLKNAYHGDTIGSVSVGGIDLFHKIYGPLIHKAIQVRPDPKEVEKTLKKRHKEIAAMIIEPLVQGAAGMLLQPKGFLKAVRKLCTKYNVLLICDEVATGFGRTGRMFACEHENISPDILCLAKGLTGGYLPVAATLTTDKIYKAFLGKHEEMKTFFHGHTYTGNPLGCAAALANLEIFRKEKTIKKLQPKIKLLKKGLKRFKDIPIVKEVRQLGMMVGIELQGFSYKDRIGHKVILEARKRGLIIRPLGDVIVLMPPLSVSMSELAKILKITYDSIRELC
ncbi:MAG: adenosylmethionine--8-amino-7-oxononanoate transaminase, partial [Candidatus Saganbacteria bacterium]|nr:adenosylmethionine--8-amino-7-oxononanoate transaminase [Candidatus Saganbacteria bacterium]